MEEIVEVHVMQPKIVKTVYIPLPLYVYAKRVAEAQSSTFSGLVIDSLLLYLGLLESGELEQVQKRAFQRVRQRLKKTVEVASGG